ncbi:MAG: prolipoprotein diacylglyceryl transferase [Gammaproteobacteria bacterium]
MTRSMLNFPVIDPVAVRIGPLAIHWYGLAYLVGIGLGWWLLAVRADRANSGWTRDQVTDLTFYAAIGAVLGGRFGYGLFYNFGTTLHEPWTLLAVWRGGMSFHGGVLGFILALIIYARRQRRSFFAVTDFVVPVVPIGLFFGRLANFINQELWGAPTMLPWAVLFTNPAAGGVPRHPSQFYEALLEGVVLFGVLNWLWRKRVRAGVISGIFLIGYAMIRIGIEFVREPDAHLGYLYGGWLTMGQILTIPMLLGGSAILLLTRRGSLGSTRALR